MLKRNEKEREREREKRKERKQDQGVEAIWKKMRFTWRSHLRISFVFV